MPIPRTSEGLDEDPDLVPLPPFPAWPLLKLIVLFLGAAGTAIGFLVGAWEAGDAWGVRPALKYEMDNMGFYLTRRELLRKQKREGLDERETGELCGLSAVLRIPTEGCD